MDITQLLAFSVKNKASDLHLSAGLPPMIRVHGDVRRINVDPLDHKAVHAMVYDIMSDTHRKHYEEFLEVDFSFEIDGLTLEVGASIGIACYPAHGDDGETLLQRADIAMYVAKADHSGAQLYETAQDQHSVQRLALAGELRRAIENDELVLHYQPKVDVATGRVIGAEALCRWQHPSLGLIMPDEFVPMAEHTGLITPLTKTVLNIALEQVAEWRRRGHRRAPARRRYSRRRPDR